MQQSMKRTKMRVAVGDVGLTRIAPEAQIGEPDNHWMSRGFVMLKHVPMDMSSTEYGEAGQALHVLTNIPTVSARRIEVQRDIGLKVNGFAVFAVPLWLNGKASAVGRVRRS